MACVQHTVNDVHCVKYIFTVLIFGHAMYMLVLRRNTPCYTLGVNIYGGSLSLCQFATKLKQEGGA